jgi:zinc transport system permease protein
MFFLSGGLAIALALVHIARDTTFSFENYLFGSILTLTSTELVVIGAATTAVLVLVWNFWYPLIGATGSPAYVIPFKRTPQFIRLLYFLILAVVVWIGIKTIGGLLIGALLVTPVLIVRAFCRSFLQITLAATGIALFATVAGLGLALYIDLPPSSLIIGVLLLLFIGNTLLRRLWRFRKHA